MKIRDLNLDDYVIVYDIGKSENSEGMTVVGKVIELEFKDDKENTALINSMGNLYHFDDNNYFYLWSDYIESKTEHLGCEKNNSVRWIDDNTLQTNLGHKINISEEMLKDTEFDLGSYVEGMINEMNKKDNSIFKVGLGFSKPATKYNQSNDLQQRKRRNIKLIDSETVEFENGRQMKVIINNRKTKPTSVYWVDDKTIGFDNGSRVRVPEYYTRENSNDTVNHPSHYNYGEIEVIDFIEQVTQHYNPNVAYHIGNAIKYIARSPHKNGKEDIAKAKWYIERAFENWDN